MVQGNNLRGVAFTQTLLSFSDVDSGVPEVAGILHNFDIPKGLVREGMHKCEVMAGQTQWTGIGDIKNKR